MRPLNRPGRREVFQGRTSDYLGRKTREARRVPPHDPWIERAWKTFGGTAARRQVDAALDSFSCGKCAYCEQVDARDIEHFRPRCAFPSRVFAWKNLLRACSVCNNAKHDRFPVDSAERRLLVDPCVDDPLEYFEWDFRTGATGVNPRPDRRPRAETTRDLLRLDRIMDERRMKIETILVLLGRVVEETPVEARLAGLLRDHLSERRPYLGIVRQLFLRPPDEYRRLIDEARSKLPDLDAWIASWL